MGGECGGHCWIAVWIGGRYVYQCLNCSEIREG